MNRPDVNKLKSDIAVEYVKSYLSKRYNCRNVSGSKERKHRGFDILAKRGSSSLKIEVKGTSKESGIPDCYWKEFVEKQKKHLMVADYMYIVRLSGASKPKRMDVLSKKEVDAYASEHSVQHRIRIAARLKTDLKNHRIGKTIPASRISQKGQPMGSDFGEDDLDFDYRQLAGHVNNLKDHLSSQGHPAFSPNEIQALLQHGDSFEPKRIRYLRGCPGRCMEIAYKELRKHPDWSLWTGFILSNGAWSAHAWNLTPRGVIIEPNAHKQPKLYYGMEILVGSGLLERRGFTEEQIRKFDAYATQCGSRILRRDKGKASTSRGESHV
jgi:hypothetical protein